MNPLYQTNDSPNAATQPTKAVNRQGVSVPRSHNTFDMSYFMYKTQHYGTLEPFFVMEGVAGDKIPLQSSHDVRTFPMSSPFLSNLKLNKDYFMVPMQAILPNSWEYIFKNPSQGDDVPDDAYCRISLEAIFIQIFNFQQSCIDSFTGENSAIAFRNYLGATLLLDIMFSSGGLLYNLGYNTSRVAKIKSAAGTVYSFDQFIDLCYSYLNVRSFTLTLDGKQFNYVTELTSQNNTHTYVSKHQMVDLLRQYFPYVTSSDIVITQGQVPQKFDFLQESFLTDVDISRVFAYQLACYQFYVNPQVDFIYNSQLWRDNLFTLFDSIYFSVAQTHLDSESTTFKINGVQVYYDFTSKHFINLINDVFPTLTAASSNFIHIYAFFAYIFGYNSALKFGDYFTDSRTRPYAPGDMNAPVVANNVSAIDITKSISMQRFLNSVVRLGNNFGDYLRGIFGTTPSPDYHFPKFIAHQEFDISGFEVANTSDTQQGSLVTNLKSQDDKFAFEVEVDMPCILIGISYFIMPSVYSQTIDRHYFHLDRFDMFNPMLQFIGDQPVDSKELTTYYHGDDGTFGYQSRFAEYKQRYSIAAGGFSDTLPAWAYVVDKVLGSERNILPFVSQSPYFIRCLASDFDRFLSGLTGNSLAHDFHFIVVYNNKCVCNRPMEVNPNIL